MAENEQVCVVLSINFNHDGSAVLLVDGRVQGYVNTERYSRIKKHPGLREEDLDELLAQSSLTLGTVDLVILCNLNNLDSRDVADLKETWFEFWLSGDHSVVSMRGYRIPCIVNPDHHLIHAAVSFYTSPFDCAVGAAIDPTGCRGYAGYGNKLVKVRQNYDRWFVANETYSQLAKVTFGSAVIGAGKLMGLAAYARLQELSGSRPDSYDADVIRRFAEAHPVYVRSKATELNATVAGLAQEALNEQMVQLLADLKKVSEAAGFAPNLFLSGGTSLNAIATEHAAVVNGFEEMHFHPACGDDGTAIGAALWYWHDQAGHPRVDYRPSDLMYSVREYDDSVVERAVDRARAELTVVRTPDYVRRTARLVAGGAIVGWYSGASEIGPRALGHRSIVADPRDPGMVARLNERVKFREPFRPFAPSVLKAKSSTWFSISDSPFMLRGARVLRPGVPAVTHVDGTARIQTVDRDDNPDYFDLISAFEQLSGVPMVLNTSLNLRGEPIAETPDDAIRALLESELDYLALPGMILGKTSSPATNL
jgi:carbamoyltransferase